MNKTYFPDTLQNICFKELWKNFNESMFVVRREGGTFFIDAANPAQKKVVAVLDYDVEGTALSSLLDASLYERFASNYNKCLDSRVPVKYEESFIKDDGRYMYYETTLFPFFSENGREYIYGICREITPLREAELELAAVKQRAEQANKSKISFLANMSHEMRTPLNGISGAVSLFLESSDYEEQAELARIINTSVESLSRLTNDILDFARLNAGTLRLEMTAFSFEELLQHVFQIVNPMKESRSLSLSYSLSHELPSVLYGDKIRIGQILVNLLGNAVKFTNHGEIKVAVDASEFVSGQVKVEISVKDTGIGIVEERIADLFQPFFQIDGTSTRKYQGAGLGLAICRQLAELMGGYVVAQSSFGQGSTFRVLLPLKTVTSSLPSASNECSHDIAGKITGLVLVVEDNQINSLVVSKILEKSGFKVICAYNGLEAVNCYRENDRIDLILMDWHMPVMSGLDATREIRRLPGGFSVPIIGITANALKEHHEECVGAGMNDVLTKPINREHMLAKIFFWLGHRGSFSVVRS